MARRSARLSRAHRGGREVGWKKSKPLAYSLIAFIIALWAYMLFFRNTHPTYPTPPTTYLCNACQNQFDSTKDFKYVTICPKCNKEEAYIAYQCTNPKCVGPNGAPFVFPLIPEIPPEVKKQMKEFEAKQKQAMAQNLPPDQMQPDMMAMDPGLIMADPMQYPGRCPKCKLPTYDPRTGEQNPNIKQFHSPEAQAIIDENLRRYEERRKTSE